MTKMALGGLVFCWLIFLLQADGRVLKASNKESQKYQVIGLLEAEKAQAAIDTLKNMRLQSLEDPELYFLLGKANLGINDFKNAEVAFKMALYFKKDYPEANYQLGLAKLQQNYPNEALYFFDQVVKAKPDWDEARRKLGECYFLVQRYEPALDAFNLLIKKNPDDFKSYYFVGKIRKAQNLLDAAVWNLQECLKIVPDYVPALKFLSQIYLENERLDDALALFDQILKSKPDSLRHDQNVANLFWTRGNQRLQQENLTEAFFDFKNVQLMLPEHPEAREIMGEIERKTDYDSLLANAVLALEAQQLEDAQLLFTKALVLAKDVREEDSVNVYLDSLNTILSERKYEVELNTLSKKAQKAFSDGDYEQALTLYQKIIILNPTDQLSLSAFKESGSLKYFIQAIREWNNENWEAALKSFEHVVSYYPSFPGMKAKRQALQHIKQIESQQIIVRKALDSGGYITARDLFFKVFQADPENPKLSEMWFQIKAMGRQQRIREFIHYATYLFAGFLILAGISLILLWFHQRANAYYWKMTGLSILLVVPTLLVVGGVFLSNYLQKPTEVELQVTADHASFFLDSDQDFEFSILSDSVAFQQISQLSLDQIQLISADGAVRHQLTQPFALLADTLKEPLSLQFKTEQSPLLLTNCRFACPTKIVLRPGQRETGMILVPHPIQKDDASWFRGDVEIKQPFQVQIPCFKKIRDDSTETRNWPLSGSYSGAPLAAKPGNAKMEVLGSHFLLNFTQPGNLRFQQFPVCDLSFKRFLPGDGSVRTIDGFQKAELSLFIAESIVEKLPINKKFNIFPNRLMLQQVENRHGKVTISLTGILTSLQMREGKSGGKEIIPNYFSWYWQTSAWVIIFLGILWLMNTLFCVALLLRLFQQRQNEVNRPAVLVSPAAVFTVEQMLRNVHENWAQNLNQLILPKWHEKIAQIQERLDDGKNETSKDALVALLQRSEKILEERKNELDQHTSGGDND